MSPGIRAELMYPGMQIMGDPDVFNMFGQRSGLIMIFFTIMPAMIGGFGNWMVPAEALREKRQDDCFAFSRG